MMRLKPLVREQFYHLEEQHRNFVPGKTRIPLAVPPYDWKEILEALEVMFSRRVLMGERVRRFEELFAEYVGVDYAVMVNSGSSANLLAMSVLTNPKLCDGMLRRGDEVITPSVTWATTVYPIVNVGLKPVLVDVELETYNIAFNQLEKAECLKTQAIMPVHLLGCPCDMNQISDFAEERGLYVIEDVCEAHGAECNGKKVGSFGDMATFSFYASHHITTMEGGMLVTNDEQYFELAKALRSNGYIRDLKHREKFMKKYPNIDPRFLFVNFGYNFRPTEVQGAFGIHQIGKLDRLIEIRRENAEYWTKRLSEHSDYFILPKEKKGLKHVYYGYPITIKPNAPFSRKNLTRYLEGKGIETRPIMAGNMDEQPVMKLIKYRKVGGLPNSRLIMRNSFFFGNHHKIDDVRREYVADSIDEFMDSVECGYA